VSAGGRYEENTPLRHSACTLLNRAAMCRTTCPVRFSRCREENPECFEKSSVAETDEEHTLCACADGCVGGRRECESGAHLCVHLRVLGTRERILMLVRVGGAGGWVGGWGVTFWKREHTDGIVTMMSLPPSIPKMITSSSSDKRMIGDTSLGCRMGNRRVWD
jgi:hypothetical protein